MSREEQVIEEKLENLLNAIIIYRDVEKKAFRGLQNFLQRRESRSVHRSYQRWMNRRSVRNFVKQPKQEGRKKWQWLKTMPMK